MNCDLVSTSPPSQYSGAYYYASVFGATLIATEDVSFDKVCHAVNVMYQYLDNDGDGNCDDERLCQELTNEEALLTMLGEGNLFKRKRRHDRLLKSPSSEKEKDSESNLFSLMSNRWLSRTLQFIPCGQLLYACETIPNSCAFPSNRASGDCDYQFDASLEEILHMITSQGLSYAYPEVFEENADSEIGKLILDLNGNCGNGYTGDWTNPSSGDCDGFYAYDDPTCGESCLVAEGIYWALTSILGAQDYSDRINNISNEWLLYSSDLVQTNAPDLYDLLTDNSTYPWLPSKLPEPYLG